MGLHSITQTLLMSSMSDVEVNQNGGRGRITNLEDGEQFNGRRNAGNAHSQRYFTT